MPRENVVGIGMAVFLSIVALGLGAFVMNLYDQVGKLGGKLSQAKTEWLGINTQRDKAIKQIASDYRAGKFNDLIARARAEMAQGKAKEL